MNFTREPIIETIITPKEGCKLLVRNSKGGDQEEYTVDAIEVVSFGHSFFFRSLERPKCFLVPVSDYEVVEVKETRVVLKTPAAERAIKIGGGREAPLRATREEKEEVVAEEGAVAEEPSEQRTDKKRDRRNRRRRRGSHEERESVPKHSEEVTPAPAAEQGGGASDETQVSSSTFSRLIPPPTTLISETISRYKDIAFSEGTFFTKPVEETEAPEAPEEKTETPEESSHKEESKEEKRKDDDEPPSGPEMSSLSRVSISESYEMRSFMSTRPYPAPGSFSDEGFRS